MWEDDLQLYHLLFIKLVLNETKKKKYESLWDLLFRAKHVLRSGQMGCVYQKVIRKSKDRVNEKYNSYSAPSHYLYQCWLIVIWTLGKNFREILIEIWTFSLKTCIWNRRQEIGGHVVSASACWRDETYSIQQLPRKTARILSFDSTRNQVSQITEDIHGLGMILLWLMRRMNMLKVPTIITELYRVETHKSQVSHVHDAWNFQNLPHIQRQYWGKFWTDCFQNLKPTPHIIFSHNIPLLL